MGFRTGLAVGSATALAGFLLMLWTENLVAERLLALDLHQPHIVKVTDSSRVDSTLNGSIVYIQGRLDVPLPIRLPDYKLSVHAVKVKRRVQMYQWIELPRDKTEYQLVMEHLEDEGVDVAEEGVATMDDMTYIKEWRDEIVNLTRRHSSAIADIIVNPSYFPIPNRLFRAQIVRVGAYRLSDYFVKHYFHQYAEISSKELPDNPNITLQAGLYYHTENVLEPQIGDVRLAFACAGNGGYSVAGMAREKGAPVTVVGRLVNETVYPFCDQHGRPVAILHENWDPLDELLDWEKALRSRPMIQYRVLAALLFAAGTSVLLLYMDKLSVAAVCSCTMISFAVCWLFHWPFHSLGLVLSASVNYYFMSQNPPRENPPQKPETPSIAPDDDEA